VALDGRVADIGLLFRPVFTREYLAAGGGGHPSCPVVPGAFHRAVRALRFTGEPPMLIDNLTQAERDEIASEMPMLLSMSALASTRISSCA
jgi:hypothetical protein